MTAFLQRNATDLAIGAVVAPLASYGLHRLFPAPHAGFLVVATSVSYCVGIAIKALGLEYARTYTIVFGYFDDIENKTTNNIFLRLNIILSNTTNVFLPIFARAVGQKMGFQVLGYLQTVAYYSLVTSAFWASKTIFEILRDAYYQGAFFPPARRWDR
jgi:hypothetical protein